MKAIKCSIIGLIYFLLRSINTVKSENLSVISGNYNTIDQGFFLGGPDHTNPQELYSISNFQNGGGVAAVPLFTFDIPSLSPDVYSAQIVFRAERGDAWGTEDTTVSLALYRLLVSYDAYSVTWNNISSGPGIVSGVNAELVSTQTVNLQTGWTDVYLPTSQAFIENLINSGPSLVAFAIVSEQFSGGNGHGDFYIHGTNFGVNQSSEPTIIFSVPEPMSLAVLGPAIFGLIIFGRAYGSRSVT